MEKIQKKLRICIAEPQDFSTSVVDFLRTFAEVDLRYCQEHELADLLCEYDVFWFRLAWRIDEKALNAQSRCRILATPVTGIDHIDEKLCENLGVKIACLRGETDFLKTVRATAELAFGLSIALMRNIVGAAQSTQNGNWNRDLFRGNEIFGKTVGILGMGRLGEIVAQYYQAFGAKVVAFEPRVFSTNTAKIVGVNYLESMEAVAEVADIVSVHINYSTHTHQIIGKHFFDIMKKNAVFINTSRGGIVDEAEMLIALQEKKIQAAALDVLQGEPNINPNHPLLLFAKANKNLLIVPHIGGNTYESFEKTEQFLAQKIADWHFNSNN